LPCQLLLRLFSAICLLIAASPLFRFFATTTAMAAKRKNSAKSVKHPSLKTGGKMPRKNLPAKAARKQPAAATQKRRYKPGSKLSQTFITTII